MNALPVKNAAEALFIACEMEKRAVKLYERALLLWPEGALNAAICGILADEKRHLARFREMAGQDAPAGADALLLSAHAAGVLFEGGLTAAARAGAFDSPRALTAFAAGQERVAIDCYARFAALSAQAATRAAFESIAQEERGHLSALETALQV